MNWHLPPLTAVRTFESAGRHLSFTQAAEELGVTPGAVSRQIKLLEEFLGTRLFERTNREVVLTAAGRTYLDTLTEILARLSMATERLCATRRDGPLSVRCSMTFTLRWLVPRLISFHTSHPGRDIKLTTSLKPIDFKTDDLDLAIRAGGGVWPDAVSHYLMGILLLPVCSPSLLISGPPLRSVADLANHTLLHSMARPLNWSKWLHAAGAGGIDPERGIRFESSTLAYQAAIEGVGVALGQRLLLSEELATGRLVVPLDLEFSDDDGYYLVYPEHARENWGLHEFRDWLLNEAKEDKNSHPSARPTKLSAFS